MTPPEHLLIGLTGANMYYSFMSFFWTKKRMPWGYVALAFSMGLVSIIADIDSFFGNYGSPNPMIGHRGMTHSIAAAALFSLVITVLIAVLSAGVRIVTGYCLVLFHYFRSSEKVLKKNSGNETGFNFCRFVSHPLTPKPILLMLVGAFIAGVSHLVTDLPQPASVWNGIPLLFPLKYGGSYVRTGGWGIIGWWDLAIPWVLFCVYSFTLLLLLCGRFLRISKQNIAQRASVAVFALVIFINLGSWFWMARYIASSNYKGETQWYLSQMKMLETFPPRIREITRRGFTVGASLFRQSRQIGL